MLAYAGCSNGTAKLADPLPLHSYCPKEKSRNMFHKLKSQRTLVNSTYIDKFLLLNKNILYLTHEVDKCVAMLRRMELDQHLQKQVDEYYPPSAPPPTQGIIPEDSELGEEEV